MRTKAVRTVLAATAVTAALMTTGCSSGSEAPAVAGGDGTGRSRPQDDNAVRRAWVDCMHKKGQTSVEQDTDGNISFPAAGVDAPGSATDLETASKACDAEVPGIHQVLEKNNEKFVEQGRAFVACARKNGYADIPDPEPATGVLVFPAKSFDTAAWDAIQPACAKLPMPGYRIGE
ncbi:MULTISPECIES: hypothetical protein [unclassified Streptomyces]|uniref:hypothetical protein n=1 Tax=unclassified Streptomyces TaxID=2593676 RepID=UPI0006F364E2|nr:MULTISPECIES: hypothetical protein [unclassified Streptomyces]KQX55813.1 hypothetical protein ASD33_31055 [Streptomyces sp. Root1304]KRA96410.1 hypothetical protein ASE09_27820 [Streptomyces sp. Root66D1]